MMRLLRSTRRTVLLVSMLAVAAVAFLVPSLFGSPIASAAPYTRASVVLVDNFAQWLPPEIVALRPPGSPAPRAVVIRRAKVAPPNLILVTSDTRPDDLTKAVGVLAQSIRRKPSGRGEMRAYVSPALTNPSAITSRPQASKDLARLAGAREYDIPGVGRRRAIAIRIKMPTRPVK